MFYSSSHKHVNIQNYIEMNIDRYDYKKTTWILEVIVFLCWMYSALGTCSMLGLRKMCKSYLPSNFPISH